VQHTIRSVIVALIRNDIARRYRIVILPAQRIARYLANGDSLVSVSLFLSHRQKFPSVRWLVSARVTSITSIPSRRMAATLRPRRKMQKSREKKSETRISYLRWCFASRSTCLERKFERELRNAKVSSEFLTCLKAAYRRYRSRANVSAVILTRNITRLMRFEANANFTIRREGRN